MYVYIDMHIYIYIHMLSEECIGTPSRVAGPGVSREV